MKINSNNYHDILKQYQEAKAERAQGNGAIHNGKSKEAEKTTTQNSAADITISKDYKIYEEAMKELNKLDNNDKKIQEIRDQILRGEYKVSPSEIAQSIIDKSIKR